MTPLSTSLLARPDRCRFVLGLTTASSYREIRAALVAARAHGLEMQLEVAATASRKVPGRLRQTFRQLRRGKSKRVATAALLAAELAELKAVLVEDVLSQAPGHAGRVLAIGDCEPGLWSRSRSGLVAHLPLTDPALLADLTGLNVIDSFAARDLAQGGRGGPLHPLPDWLLLHHRSKTRVLVDLGPAARVTLLPGSRDAAGAERIVSWVAGPGMRLVDRFARQLTAGHERCDIGGHLAVQGSRISEILELWLADASLRCAQDAVRSLDRFPIRSLVQSGIERSVGLCSVRDLLCTATYLIAECIARVIADKLPDEPAVDEIVLTGGGQQHGLLVQQLTERLAPWPVVRESELGLAATARDGAVAATLALLHLDQTPACATAISGAQTPRVLGRLTPGSPQAWQRVLQSVAGRGPSVVSLRSAM